MRTIGLAKTTRYWVFPPRPSLRRSAECGSPLPRPRAVDRRYGSRISRQKRAPNFFIPWSWATCRPSWVSISRPRSALTEPRRSSLLKKYKHGALSRPAGGAHALLQILPLTLLFVCPAGGLAEPPPCAAAGRWRIQLGCSISLRYRDGWGTACHSTRVSLTVGA
jgi:hypothetical protein